MRARKLLAASLVLATSVMGIAACSSSGGGQSSGGKVTLTLWHNATTGDGKAFWEKTAADFQTANPNVTIKIQSIQNEDMDGKLQTALNSGDAPDVFLQRGGGKMAAMVKAGQLMDITGSITDATKKVISDGSFKSETIDNKIYAMPMGVLPGGFFYSKDLFTQAGITQPPDHADRVPGRHRQAQGSQHPTDRGRSQGRLAGRLLLLLLRAARM